MPRKHSQLITLHGHGHTRYRSIYVDFLSPSGSIQRLTSRCPDNRSFRTKSISFRFSHFRLSAFGRFACRIISWLSRDSRLDCRLWHSINCFASCFLSILCGLPRFSDVLTATCQVPTSFDCIDDWYLCQFCRFVSLSTSSRPSRFLRPVIGTSPRANFISP